MDSRDSTGFNMADLVGRMAEIQRKMADVKNSLADLTVEAEVGGGMVKVTATGAQRIKSIRIERGIVDPDDVEMLEDLVTAGVNRALHEASEAAGKRVKDTAGTMFGPGLDLSRFGL